MGKVLFFILLLVLGLTKDSNGEPPTTNPTPHSPSPDVKEEEIVKEDDFEKGEEQEPLIWAQMDSIYMLKPCNHSREVIENSMWGRISDGPFNYTQDTTCEFLIKAPPGYWISLKIDRVRTECSYDYLFIVDGNSYVHSKLLASFSGASDPHVILLAQSGYMLIMLYSDPNYVLQGFQAEYTVSACPLNCSGAGECIQIQNKHVCKCQPLRMGVACQKILKNDSLTAIEQVQIQNTDLDRHEVISTSWNSPLSRVGHSVILVDEEKLYIFGGFDLNLALDNLITFDLVNNRVEKLNRSESFESIWPSGRYGHVSVKYKGGFFVHGGKTENKEISSQLFFYDIGNSSWTEISSPSLPKLMYHTMTSADSGDIYVFGGGNPAGEFSRHLYKFHGESPSHWTIVQPSCCGKDIQRSVLGHTMTYWPQKNALILFGGVGSSDGRFSKLSSQLWMYFINSSTWMNLDYKKNGGGMPVLHPERAFHTATIVNEKYLTIYGGYTHVHNKDETCYSDQMLVFNLECQIFLPIVPTSFPNEVTPTVGLFGHQSIVFKDNLVIIGGYRGYLSQGISKVPLFTKSSSSECSTFDRWRCSGEPKCGWCPTNKKCFDKHNTGNCTTNLQTVQCPGICPLLSSCDSCVIPGCVWCGSTEVCLPKESTACNNPLDHSSQTNVVQCADRNFRMGLSQFTYLFPPNFSNPDSVKVINGSVLVIPKVGVDKPVTMALRGGLVGISFTNLIKKLELCTLQAAVNLSMSIDSESFNSSYKWTDYQLCYNLTWPSSGSPVSLLPGQKILFDLIATSFEKGVNQEKSGRVTIQLKYYSGPISSPRMLRRDHLLPFDGSYIDANAQNRYHHHCLSYNTCLPCTGDVSCIWRLDTLKCIPRLISLPMSNKNSLTGENELISNPILESISKVIIQPEDCPMCQDYVNCGDCLESKFGLECEWSEEEIGGGGNCIRKGRLDSSITDKGKCPDPCTLRKNCSSCLDSVGKCVWCQSGNGAGECFLFSSYTSVYNFGICLHWVDKVEMCKRCDRQPTCDSCVTNIGCGWSYDESGGSCSEGDFGGPSFRNPISKGSSEDMVGELLEADNKTWSYGVCPDVNECELEIDDCNQNATCINTPGSYTCVCNQGFTGDGRTSCERTCYEPCLHGTCSPDFICECDLGWTGPSCQIDCLCNNNSFCSNKGPGTCDKCERYTTGQFCHQCVEGSYGNASVSSIGCLPCTCNGHGDVSAGLCDSVTGHCFCVNDTTGRSCEDCENGFYGNPQNGGPCYQTCTGRGLLLKKTGFFGLAPDFGFSKAARRKQQNFQSRNSSFVPVEHCMWIINGSYSEDQETQAESTNAAGILLTIEPGFDIPCSQNVLFVHKGYSEFGVNGKGVPLVAAVCNDQEDKTRRTTPIFITVEGSIATIFLKYARMGSTKFNFNGSFKLIGEEEMEARIGGTRSKKEPFNRSALNMPNFDNPFNMTSLYDGTSPTSVLSRFGHSLHVDQKNLWIFGGYSLSHGPLNDIRHFSRESNSWVPLTVIVQQNDESVPPARYFHSGTINNLVIIIHGGISLNLNFLKDTWKFDTKTSRWQKICEGPKVAGHSLTLRPSANEALGGLEDGFLILIGGFNPEFGFNDKVYMIGNGNDCWTEVETTGSNPLGIYGHSTAYHLEWDAFYVYGGTLYDMDIFMSARLFVLDWKSKRWSVLSQMEDNQVFPRFLHTVATTNEYMIVLGGIGGSVRERNSIALIYVYQCNLWILIRPREEFVASPTPELLDNKEGLKPEWPDEINIRRVAAGNTMMDNEIFQMGGWQNGKTSESLFLLRVPSDPCSLQKTKERCKGTLGCAYCSSNNNSTQQCYSAKFEMPFSCSSGASNIEFWKGIPCTSTFPQSCERFSSCTECLAAWPNQPNATDACQWCTNGKEGRCIPLNKQFDEDSPCGLKQSYITDPLQCPERICSAPQCEKCIAGKCIWTRQILRSRERSWELRLQPVYDWNCVRKTILDTSSVSVVSSPPNPCPIKCWHFDSCFECLESPGGEGGFHQCYWSVNQRRCISPAYMPLTCFGGLCGPVLKGNPLICPKACTTLRSCNSCLENPSCGWCSVNGANGEGVCLSTATVSESNICSNHSKWDFLTCPKENECENGHNGCDLKSEECIDLEDGYKCQCRTGFLLSADSSCLPICENGCVHGSCVEPGKCRCNFGYTGTNCSAQCDCNGHSNCAGIHELDTCIKCENNTMGHKCSQCSPLFVGDPTNNGACISCRDFCNSHSDICLSREDFNMHCNGTNKHLTSSQLISKIRPKVGQTSAAFCCHCANHTRGDTCDDCTPGFFRGYDDKRLKCRPCECQGHGDSCDAITGTNCNCNNNTESEHCTQNTLKQNPHYQCFKHQCSKCKDSYIGSPTGGHQCYIQMQMEEFYCFDPKSQDQSCVMKQKPLPAGRTVFFAVQPKFMNVNIRVTLDVTHGSINVYLSPKDDTFLIKQDDRWIHRVDFDSKYSLSGDRKESIFGKATSFSGENNKIEPDYEFMSNKSDDVEESGGVNRVIQKPMGTTPNSFFRFIEHEAAGYATYYTVQDPKAVLLVRNLRNRLVITLPQDSHDLRLTRFYLVLEGIGDVSFGSIVFRQDQLHIDLFVFFSVFFSAFFLFLAGCGIAWKVKQNMEVRRARHARHAEMLSMAKRPFASCVVLCQPEVSSGISEAFYQCRKSCRKGCICLRPISCEWIAGASNSNAVITMLINLPGGNDVPVRMALASVLANLQRSHGPYHARRRRLNH